MGIALSFSPKRGSSMRELYANSHFQPSIAQRLEVVAWLGLFASACLAGFLIISM